MAFFKRKAKTQTNHLPQKAFDANEKHPGFKLCLFLMKKGHGVPTNDLLLENGVNLTLLLYAQGTKNATFASLFSGNETNTREAIFALVPHNKVTRVREAFIERFSRYPEGTCTLLTFEVSALAGVLAYKFLTDYEGAEKYGEKKSD
ncbi:MAG: hypothetical protein MJ207_00830 [Bacilli bacterium]|nr:hypothetical protein [Bacilli bacterium]